MRTSPYSLDIREKIIKLIKSGKTQLEASKQFRVSVSAVGNWWRRYKKEGHYKPRKRLGKKCRMCPNKLERYLNNNPKALLKEIGIYFGMTGSGASYCMKKLGYSYKKKALPTWSQTKKRRLNT